MDSNIERGRQTDRQTNRQRETREREREREGANLMAFGSLFCHPTPTVAINSDLGEKQLRRVCQKERYRDRQTDRQTYTHTDRQADIGGGEAKSLSCIAFLFFFALFFFY